MDGQSTQMYGHVCGFELTYGSLVEMQAVSVWEGLLGLC